MRRKLNFSLNVLPFSEESSLFQINNGNKIPLLRLKSCLSKNTDKRTLKESPMQQNCKCCGLGWIEHVHGR